MKRWFLALMLFATSGAVGTLATPKKAEAGGFPRVCFYCYLDGRCGRGTLGGAACASMRDPTTGEIWCQEWGWCEVF